MIKSKTYDIKTDFSILTDTKLVFNALFLRDFDDERERIENLEHHIEADDYFGSLATIIDLVRQEMKSADPPLRETLGRLKNDLLYLQKNYRIVKK